MSNCKHNILVEDEKILQDEKAIAKTFSNVTHSLHLKKKNI